MARYITTTLPYVNADPHIGFALELIQADTLARLWRLSGEEVFFNIGTDEHGQKIWEAAEKKGQPIQEYVDHYANEILKLKDALSLTNDAFIRTTNPDHIKAAQEMWRTCDAKGDIYKKSYEGWYCVGCEAFKTEHEIIDGHCELHPSLTPEKLKEENYFFRLSKYQDRLLAYLEQPGVIVPEWRREEALNFVRAGLEDFSISREKRRLSWGVPVPADDAQVMYVWFDALTSYISTLGWPEDGGGKFKKFWQEGTTLQMGGKDQVRFQSIMWQAMLMSADIKLTDKIFYHGFINSGGQRMSKSLGNVISPYELVEKYGKEATRYMLLRHVHPVEDSDVTWERLDEWYTANLVNGLGNVVARVMQLAQTYLVEPAFQGDSSEVLEAFAYSTKFNSLMDNFEFSKALETVWSYVPRIQGTAEVLDEVMEHSKLQFASIASIDESIQSTEPFKVVKENREKGMEMIKGHVREIALIGKAIEPFMPETSNKILTAVFENKKPENLFPRLP